MKKINILLDELLVLISSGIMEGLLSRYNTGRSSRKCGYFELLCFHLVHSFTKSSSMRSTISVIKSIMKIAKYRFLNDIPRSTISDANRDLDYKFFEDLFKMIYNKVLSVAPKNNVIDNTSIYCLDATIVTLCATLIDWANYRTGKSGIKINTLLNLDGNIPELIQICNASEHESKLAKEIDFNPGSIVVFDRGYNDNKWFCNLEKQGVYFVGRMKGKTKYKVIERQGTNGNVNILSDNIIEIKLSDNKTFVCRRISYVDREQNKFYQFITNNFILNSQVIADIYKKRWEIETFFKIIKQNTKIIKPIGYSKNAVCIQIYVSIISYLMMSYYKFRQALETSVQQMFRIISVNLFNNTSLNVVFEQFMKKKVVNKQRWINCSLLALGSGQ